MQNQLKQSRDIYGRSGVGTLLIQAEFPEKAIASAQHYGWMDRSGHVVIASSQEIRQVLEESAKDLDISKTGLIALREHNAYVNTGLNNSLDREFGLGGAAVSHIGVSSNTAAVTAATTFLNGPSAGSAANTIIKSISPAATRTNQTVTGGATFQNADFTSGVFIWNKIGFLNTATDAGTGLIDVIGGTGGSAPYNRTFSLNLTAAGTFTVIARIAVTAVAV